MTSRELATHGHNIDRLIDAIHQEANELTDENPGNICAPLLSAAAELYDARGRLAKTLGDRILRDRYEEDERIANLAPGTHVIEP